MKARRITLPPPSTPGAGHLRRRAEPVRGGLAPLDRNFRAGDYGLVFNIINNRQRKAPSVLLAGRQKTAYQPLPAGRPPDPTSPALHDASDLTIRPPMCSGIPSLIPEVFPAGGAQHAGCRNRPRRWSTSGDNARRHVRSTATARFGPDTFAHFGPPHLCLVRRATFSLPGTDWHTLEEA